MKTAADAVIEILLVITGLDPKALLANRDANTLCALARRNFTSTTAFSFDRIRLIWQGSYEGDASQKMIGLLHTDWLSTEQRKQLSRLERKYPAPGNMLKDWDFGFLLNEKNLYQASTDPLYTR